MTDEVASVRANPPAFRRSLSGFGVIILTLSVLSPGVSVLVSGGSILTAAGTWTALAFVLGSVVCYIQTVMAAELGAAYPTAGYDYAAIGHAVGDWAGATTYIASIVSVPLFINVSAAGIAIYLQPFGVPLSPNGTTFVVMGIVTAAALLNIRANEFITGIFMLIECVALLLIAGLGAAHAQPHAAAAVIHPMRVVNGAWIATGIAIGGIAVNNASWALAGSSQALMFSEDMKHPRTIGRIIMLSFAITVVLETAPMVGVIIGSHDLRAVLGSNAPFETFLAQFLPDFGLKLVSMSIAIAIFNACLAGLVGTGRTVFSMGRTRLFAPPVNRALLQMIRRTSAPWVAILLIAITAGLATYVPLYFKVLLLSGNYTVIAFFYTWGVLAGRRSGRTGQTTYRAPAFPLIVLLGALIVVGEVVVLWLDPESGRKSLFVCAGVYALSYCYYRFVLRRRPGGWVMTGPEDIDASTRTASGSRLPDELAAPGAVPA
jgi:amino acid transporter